MLIRQYLPSDQAQVWELHNKALHAVNAHAGKGEWDNDLQQIEEIYLKNGGEFLVGIRDNRLIAMGALRHISINSAEIKRMRVDPEFQRKGLGQIILNALEKRARELGYKNLQLDTTMKQVAAQKFYEKNGFQIIRRGKLAGFECLFYEKSLILTVSKCQ